jgi:hypothetical protein
MNIIWINIKDSRIFAIKFLSNTLRRRIKSNIRKQERGNEPCVVRNQCESLNKDNFQSKEKRKPKSLILPFRLAKLQVSAAGELCAGSVALSLQVGGRRGPFDSCKLS